MKLSASAWHFPDSALIERPYLLTLRRQMRILGIDPGTLITGYGVIDSERSEISLVDYGVIKMRGAMELSLRLDRIFTELTAIIERTIPDCCAIESAFYSKNVQSTLKLGHARGVSMLAATRREIPVCEYSPREVKQAVTGNGSATKEQVEYMIVSMLKMKKQEELLDATDALAIAICHGNRINNPITARTSWEKFIKENPERVR